MEENGQDLFMNSAATANLAVKAAPMNPYTPTGAGKLQTMLFACGSTTALFDRENFLPGLAFNAPFVAPYGMPYGSMPSGKAWGGARSSTESSTSTNSDTSTKSGPAN